MTNLTFAELTALMAVNGLVINDRYFITDKDWTIIAISTSTYRVVVPIVTEVTKAQLDALVADNGLNEGLQYLVTDKNWLLIAISNNQLTPISNVLEILNSDIYPAYIITETLKIDSGIIDTDISVLDTLVIGFGISGFAPASIEITDIINNDILTFFNGFGNCFKGLPEAEPEPLTEGSNYIFYPVNFFHVEGNRSIIAGGNGNGNSCRFIVTWKKI